METELLVDLHSAIVSGAVRRLNVDEYDESGTRNDEHVIDFRRCRSSEPASVGVSSHSSPVRSLDPVVSRQSVSPTSATYWCDVINNDVDKMAAGRCESCNSDISEASLPETLTSDGELEMSPCKKTVSWTPPISTGNSLMPVEDQKRPETKRNYPSTRCDDDANATSTTSSHHADFDSNIQRLAVHLPTPAGFSITDILRPDFGMTPRSSRLNLQQPEPAAAARRCPSYPGPTSLLPSTLRRSLVHPYTAAAAFCAAAVAAAAAAGGQPRTPTDPVHRQQHMRAPSTDVTDTFHCSVRRPTSPRDVTYHVINNNNTTKLHNRYSSYGGKDDLSVDVARQKTSARRTRVEPAALSSVRTSRSVANTSTSGPRQPQSVLTSPASQTSSTTLSSGASRQVESSQVDGKQSSSDEPSPALVALPWPAWVYCTRYSDRPSSGPRTRKPKKKEHITDEKRPRTAFTAAQLDRLKREFDDSKYLTEERRQSLANELQLNESQIKIWFQNKRAKMKKASGVRNQLALQLMAQGLYNHSSVVQR